MPSLFVFLAITGFLTWWFNALTWQIFIALCIVYYLFDEVLPSMIRGIGFVSKEKYEKVVKDKKEAEDKLEETVEALDKTLKNLDKTIERLKESFDEDDIQEARIKGQNAIFSAFAYNKVEFQKHLNVFLAEEASKQYEREAKRKSREQKVNQKGPPLEDMWHTVLGVTRIADYETTKQSYRNLSKRYHPDRPEGDAEKMKKINAAWAEAEKHFGKA